jgi:hypothetical protein
MTEQVDGDQLGQQGNIEPDASNNPASPPAANTDNRIPDPI